MREKTKQKCPRCGEVSHILEKQCDNCGLIFERLQYASNLEAKKCIKAGEREKVIRMKKFPSDRKRWVAMLLCALGGWIGLHNFYVGRYLRGAYLCLMTIIATISIIFFDPALQTYLFNTWLLIPAGLVIFVWGYDCVLLAINRFKVPVALKMSNVERAKTSINIKGNKNEEE